MNIALFIPNIKPVCGRSKIGISLLEGLIEKSENVFLITNPESDLSIIPKTKNQVLIIPCNPNQKSLFRLLRCVHSIRKFVKVYQIELINSHHRYAEFISLLSRLIFRLNIKIVTTVHSFTKGFKIFSYNADRIISVSSYLKDHLINYYSKKNTNIEVIYNGVEKKYNDISKSGRKEKYILGFGRLEYEKGFDILIHALSCIKDKIVLPKLMFVGEGSQKNELRMLAEKMNVEVDFLQYDSTPWEMILNSLFVIVPSREEPLGLVILESGLINKAVIASRVGGIPEIIENNKSGLLFENENYFQLSELISKLLNDKELADKHGDELNRKVLKQFSYQQMINDYLRVFKSLSI